MPNSFRKIWPVALLLLAACGTEPSATTQSPPATATIAPATAAPTVSGQTPTVAPATTAPEAPVTIAIATAPPTLAPTTVPAPTATIAPQPTATVNSASLPPRYIEAMRARSYDGGEIVRDRLYEQNAAYTGYTIFYKSDSLRISGLMMTPNGAKDAKYPVALINHGYFAPADYDTAWDTLREDRYFARNGYITIASDYRNYARSDKGDNDRAPGYSNDILNLIEAVKKLPNADPTRITIMGHSMGGEITLNALVVSKDIKAAALFGSMSADATDNYYARIGWRGGDTAEKAIYGDPKDNADAYKRMSPLTYFADITAPVIIHSGDKDNVTPPAWSLKLFNALQGAKKTTEFYTYSGEGHSLNGAAFDSAMTRTLAFFNKAIGR